MTNQLTEQESKQPRDILGLLFRFREQALLILIVLIALAVSLRAPVFLSARNLNSIVSDIVVLSIVAVGQAIVIVSGGIDLSVGTGLGLVAMSVGLIHIYNPAVPPVVMLLLGMGFGSLLGLLNGILVAKGKVLALIGTLATMNIFRGLTVLVNAHFYRSQYIGADKLSDAFKQLTRGNLLGLPNILVLLLLVFACFYYFLNYTEFGRGFYAIGSNEFAAEAGGYHVKITKASAYVISGALAGLGGVLWVSLYATAQSDTGLGLEFATITAVVVGGVSVKGGSGSVIGVLLGAVLIGVVTNGLNVARVSPFWKDAINGAILLFAVLLNNAVEVRMNRRFALERATDNGI